MSDLIYRQAAIDEAEEWIEAIYCEHTEQRERDAIKHVINGIKALPSAQPEIKPISYQDCADAMMMMWMDNVLTDGEYRRIMDKLNDYKSGKENR